jgi:hypothetical protein
MVAKDNLAILLGILAIFMFFVAMGLALIGLYGRAAASIGVSFLLCLIAIYIEALDDGSY